LIIYNKEINKMAYLKIIPRKKDKKPIILYRLYCQILSGKREKNILSLG
jgi:hypothetical protein